MCKYSTLSLDLIAGYCDAESDRIHDIVDRVRAIGAIAEVRRATLRVVASLVMRASRTGVCVPTAEIRATVHRRLETIVGADWRHGQAGRDGGGRHGVRASLQDSLLEMHVLAAYAAVLRGHVRNAEALKTEREQAVQALSGTHLGECTEGVQVDSSGSLVS